MKTNLSSLLKKIKNKKQAEFPKEIKPMLATLIDEPFDEEGWLYEVKWDGFRALVYCNNSKVKISSRNNKSFNDKFYPVFNEFNKLNLNVVFDGEIVILDKKGMPDFAALQSWRSEADGHLVYYIFDILWLDGFNLMKATLQERRTLLEAIVPDNKIIKVSETLETSATDFFKIADNLNLEGIIAKMESSCYAPGKRTRDWLKIKTQRFQEVVIGGYTVNEGSSKKFSSLLVGIFDKGEFVSAATVGTGFTARMQNELLKKNETINYK